MKDRDDFAEFGALSQDLNHTCDFQPFSPQLDAKVKRENLIELELEAEEPFRFGQGEKSLTGARLKLLPLTEAVVSWNNGRGKLSTARILIPASAVKGALRHRTLFHYNLLTGRFDHPNEAADEEAERRAALGKGALQSLFGYSNQEKRQGGRAGCLFFDDLYLNREGTEPGPMMHNGIDRFTGGVRRHVLYGEELLFGRAPLRLRIHIAVAAGRSDSKEERALWRALYAALKDLAEGRLALGGGTNRGHGYFRGTLHWPSSIAKGDDHATS